MASLEGIEAGSLLGRYRVQTRLPSSERAHFRAKEEGSDSLVCLLELREDEVDAYRALAQARPEHAHLAKVREVFRHEQVPLLVFPHLEGMTLTTRLREVGKKPAVEAVGSALRVTDALSNLHDAGGVHGFIHTDSVIVDPPERLGPVLTFAPVPSDERTFHSPERGETGKPSVVDDAWAAAGLLHMMLTGEPPPKDGYANIEELGAVGVVDVSLSEALLHGLNRRLEERGSDVRPLKRALARWYVEHAGEEPVHVGPPSTMPPPLPPGTSNAVSPAVVIATQRPLTGGRRPRFLLIAVVGTLVGVGGAWGFSSMRKPEVQALPPEPAAAPPPEPSAKAIDLSEVPVTGEEQSVELDKTASCVAGYLPKGAFAKSPDLAWVCTETDPIKGAEKLRVAVVASAPKGQVTQAMKVFARLGWYDMAAYAVVRAGCCEEPVALTLPQPAPGCDSMTDALRDIAREVTAGKSHEEPFKKYTAAVHCEMNLGRGQSFGHSQRPLPGEDTAFEELVQSIAH